MKIAIAIMSSNHSVSMRNTECQIETFVNNLFSKDRRNEYRVYFYRGRKDINEKVGVTNKGNYYEVVCSAKDSILSTFEKTCEAYSEIMATYDFDFLVRCNISCYLNVNLLDSVMTDDIDNDLVLCNSINTAFDIGGTYMNQLYPRGDFYIIGRENVLGALNYADAFINGTVENHTLTHVDDVLFGMCLYEHKKGRHAYDNLHTVMYGYYPQEEITKKEDVNPFCLSYRVKTVPPSVTHSGYGWEDNVWRNCDVNKMRFLNDYLKNAKYGDDIKLSKLIIPDKFAKKCAQCECGYDSISVDKMKDILISRFV